MKLFRNPEVLFVLRAGLPAAIVFWLLIGIAVEWKNWVVLSLSGAAFLLLLVLFFSAMDWHYRKVIRFRERIESNQNGEKDLQFSDFSEGEFSDLQKEVKNLVVTHFCQQEEVQADKDNLAEALANIAHQIYTPMFNIQLTAQRLSDPSLDPLERELLAHKILKQSARVDALVKARLQLSRMDAGVLRFHPEMMTAKALIDKVCDALDVAMELNGIDLVCDVPESIVLRCDSTWMPEALINILKNCIEHTPSGGRITITVTENDVYTTIVIRDTGTGIREEDQPYIFDRFYKGKESSSDGFGIGLAFSKQLIESMEGNIKAGNNPDCGAVFTIKMRKIIV